MKKFIEVIEEKGIVDNLVNSIKYANKVMDCDIKSPNKSIKTILKMEMINDDDELFDLFLKEAEKLGFKEVIEYVNKKVEESEKIDALNDVNPDELFKKAMEQGDSGLKKSNEEALEDAVVGSFVDFLNGIANMLNN